MLEISNLKTHSDFKNYTYLYYNNRLTTDTIIIYNNYLLYSYLL